MSNVDKHAAGTPSWFDVMTPDLEGARKFYGELFGWTFDVGPAEMGYYTTCKLGDRRAAGMGKRPDDVPYPPAWTMYFATDDANASADAIRAGGGTVTLPPMDVMDLGRMLVAIDPAGAPFGFWQAKLHTGAEVVNEHGAMCWAEVASRDSAKEAEFYTKLLGAEISKMEGMEYWVLKVNGEMTSGIMHMDEKWPAEIPSHWLVYFTVNDADAACEKIKALGGKVMHGPFDSPYGPMAVVADPWGAVFAVIKTGKPAA